MTNRLADKIIIVTGAARGVGLENAKMMVNEGATVVMTDINSAAGEKAAQQIGDSAHFFKQDVSQEQDWTELVAFVEHKFGRLDVLVNNAAILKYGEITNETFDGWRNVHAVNSDSVFLGIQACLPMLEKSGGGSIVNMSSSAAIFGMPYFVAYSASKSAVRGITRAVAVHCSHQQNNVRCNSIHPDGIATEMPMEIAHHMPPLDQAGMMKAMKYTCMPEDISKVVVFLASDESSGINGEAIRVDKSATITPPYF